MKTKGAKQASKPKSVKSTSTRKIRSDQKITPFLWFDGQAEEAANFYTSIFDNSKILDVARYGEAGPGEKGSVMTVSFELEGQRFVGLNGGPHYKFTPAISFYISCETQEEVDYFWERLLEGGGKPNQCGWLADGFGVSWQVVPDALIEFLQDEDREKAQRVMNAMLQMEKIEINKLKEAYGQK
jgi:predicted 3-demethylubiquinone-9 3-methyltransferase (glyoxalase superfamily)